MMVAPRRAGTDLSVTVPLRLLSCSREWADASIKPTMRRALVHRDRAPREFDNVS